MNFCPHCGKSLNDTVSFCSHCGKSLSVTKTKSNKKLIIGALIAFITIAVAAFLLLYPFGGNFSDNPDAIQEAANSVVKIYMYDINGIGTGTGSGFAALDQDIIITNYHCIDGDVHSIVAERKDGSTFSIESIIAYNKEKDIAVLRAPNCKLTPLKTANGLDTKQGEKLAAIGSPEGMSNMFSTGTLSKISDFGTHRVLLSTVSISHGSSGGALFNNKGQVIGITSAGHTEGNEIYLSVPIEYAQKLYDTRNPKEEITIAAFYEQGEHPYDVGYLLLHGQKLQGKKVTVQGYVSGYDTLIYLVSSKDEVLSIKNQKPFNVKSSISLYEQKSIKIHKPDNAKDTVSVSPGDQIQVEGTLRYYDSSDIHIIASKITVLK